jgi:two-component system, NtrC family, response regulator AlgB
MATKLLLIGDRRKNRRLFAWGFSGDEYHVQLASSRASVEKLLARHAFQVACIDLRMADDNADAIIQMLSERVPRLPIIALMGETAKASAVRCEVDGIAAVVASPLAIEHLHTLVRSHALSHPVMLPAEPTPPSATSNNSNDETLTRLMMNDEVAQRTLELALRAAKSNAVILILGETGTGKSLLARTIHQHSAIRNRPFVTVNCPCLNRELLESELFGHVRGAFTGAVQDTEGKVAAADGGTLFLDEIGDLPTALQPKLLRLLQEKQYERVGDAESRRANVRIIAATSRDLKTGVRAGYFREDLYYRLNVIAIEVPALRGRPAQIMGAAEAFLESISAQLGRHGVRFSSEARRILTSYSWPGNIRELRNVVERAAILSSGSTLSADDFPAMDLSPRPTYQVGEAISLRALENAHIQMVIAKCGSLEEAARILEIDKSTLYRKRKQIESRLTPFASSLENRSANVATAS